MIAIPAGGQGFTPFAIGDGAGFALLFWWLLTRFGVLAALVAVFVQMALGTLDVTLDSGSWHLHTTVVSALFVVGLGVWCWRAALRGRQPFASAD